MKFNEIENKNDLLTFFKERQILKTEEDPKLLKIDERHFLRLLIEDELDLELDR
ncbi:MAG: hypothetical protein GF311_21795 [Candidatus Lokiarchaeota archaeon]|nr:hypothetical protein [Candidatus Lokiarchaeota archaeon]